MQQPQVNFLPQSYALEVHRRLCTVRQSVLMLGLAGTLALWWVVQTQQTASLRRDANTIETQVRTAEHQMNEAVALRAKYQTLRHQVRVQQLLAAPLRHTQILATLGEQMPDSVTVLHLGLRTQRPAPAALTGAKNSKASHAAHQGQSAAAAKSPHEVDIELTALAPDDMTVANLLSALKKHPLFTDATIYYSRPVERYDVVARQFSLGVRVDLDRKFEAAPSPSQNAAQNPVPDKLQTNVGEGVAHVE